MIKFQNLVESHSSTQLPNVLGVGDALGEIKNQFEGKVHDLEAPLDLKQLSLSQAGRNLVFVNLPPSGEHNTDSYRKSLGQAGELPFHPYV